MPSSAPKPPSDNRPLDYGRPPPPPYPWWHDVVWGLIAAAALFVAVGGFAAWLFGAD